MAIFKLKIADRTAPDARTIEFEGNDNAEALNKVSCLPPGQRAELWRDNDFVCVISSDAGGPGVWKIEGR